VPVVRPTGRMGQLGLVLPIAPPGNPPAQPGSTTRRTGGSTLGRTTGVEPGLAQALAARCAAAEDAGATGLWAVDHLFWGTPMLECLSTLAVAATATTRPILGSCVLQLPLRRAAAVAKQAATLQLLSGGRLVLGVGVGSHPGEYRLAGADFARRGRDLDRGLDELRRCWSGDDDRYQQAPAPPPIPVWVGGSSPAALERAARLGDGWVPLFVDPEDYRGAVTDLHRRGAEAGRRDRLAAAGGVPVSLGATTEAAAARGTSWLGALYRLPARAFARHLVAGDARHCADHLRRYLDGGADHVAVMVAGDRAVEQFAELAAAMADVTGGALPAHSPGIGPADVGPPFPPIPSASVAPPQPEPLEVPA